MNEEIGRGKLPLNDELALERTKLANERTLLAFIRTSMYFALAGLTVVSVLKMGAEWIIASGFWVISLALLFVGIRKYRVLAKKLYPGYDGRNYWRLLMHEEE